MPYDASTGNGVPSRIKGSKRRRQWASVWNSTYQQTHDEGRAFAAANAVYNRTKGKKKKAASQLTLIKSFGTDRTGYVSSDYFPFHCASCDYFEVMAEGNICTSPKVADDPDVPTDNYGNKIVEENACCNDWTPDSDEEGEE